MNPYASFLDSFRLRSGTEISFFRLNRLEDEGYGEISRFPRTLKIVLESLLRLQDHPAYSEDHVVSFSRWRPNGETRQEYPYMPSRVLLQDFTGVPCVVDLAALRSSVQKLGGDPASIEPQIPVDLVIDHSVQVDAYGKAPAFDLNLNKEFERNRERYQFLRWGQSAFEKLNILPPGLGICHQVNMEYLASCVSAKGDSTGHVVAYPDTLVGTDSHTTMINSMGILGWGVGGIEAEAAMLGQPIPLLTPIVTGFKLSGALPAHVTPTDMALRITEMLREQGVVGHFVEFFGPGVAHLSLADRAPVANMAPEYGATMGYFPIDDATLTYLRLTGRTEEQVDLVERYCKEQGLWYEANEKETLFDHVLQLDLSTVEPSVAGPKRPQDRVLVRELHQAFEKALCAPVQERGFGVAPQELGKTASLNGKGQLQHGSVVIAAITSCTNTSNPSLLLGAGLLAKHAVERGLTVPPYVKTSLAPGSRVVTEYLQRSGLMPYLEQLGFHVVAYGCTTCIGNSGPLLPEIEEALRKTELVAAAVLSGNRNFEGRIHPLTQANYLCSPPLVVAYALIGNVNVDLINDPLGTDSEGKPVFLNELWPTDQELQELMEIAADPAIYGKMYSDVSEASPAWNTLSSETGSVYAWEPSSTYIREPTFFENLPAETPPLRDVQKASILALFGDFVTTDHISPAGAIPKDGPAGAHLIEHDVLPEDFNSFGSRRGNHEVMMRGTFANIRIRNKMVDHPGGATRYLPTGHECSIYEAAMKYKEAKVPLMVVAGKMYGAGSSRDWAAKGTFLLGVRAVLAESFERIHRSNLVEMGVLPLEFTGGDTAESLGWTGEEQLSISGIEDDLVPGKNLELTVHRAEATNKLVVKCRIDSPIEIEYYRHGGILQYVLRDTLSKQTQRLLG